MEAEELTERDKSLCGMAYEPNDPELVELRAWARHWQSLYNKSDPPPPNKRNLESSTAPAQSLGDTKVALPFSSKEQQARKELLASLFGVSIEQARELDIEPPFYCDYGINITFKGSFYCNYNTVILDCAKVTIGTRVLMGPAVQLYAATHKVDVDERRSGLERAYPITIGDDVWIGGQAIILGPVVIGDGAVVAAGSVVTKDVEPLTVVAGNPARVVRRLDAPTRPPKGTSV